MRQMRGCNASERWRPDAGRPPQCGIELRRFLQSVQAFCDERRLIGTHRVIELEVNPYAARLARRRDAALGITGDECAAADFADDKAAAQQLCVDTARPRDGDLALPGKIALRRQAVTGFERAVGDFRRDGVGQLQIFEPRHIAPRAMFIEPRAIFVLYRVLYRIMLLAAKSIVPETSELFAVNEPTARSKERLCRWRQHCRPQTLQGERCPHPFQISPGPLPGGRPARSLSFSAPVGMQLRAISSPAPPSQPFANSTTAPCGTSASTGATSKRPFTVSSSLPTRRGCHDDILLGRLDGNHDRRGLRRRVPD